MKNISIKRYWFRPRTAILLVAVISITTIITLGCEKVPPSTPATTSETSDIPTFTGLEVVYFRDSFLEDVIRSAISKPTGDITTGDLKGLTELLADRQYISDLTGLQYCTDLTFLALGGNYISDISQLASLTNLTVLYLWDNQISDISPLASLTKLEALFISNNMISDMSPLSSLTNLYVLYIMSNRIESVTPLMSLLNIMELNLSHNLISNISPLVGNIGLWQNDRLILTGNPLQQKSLNYYIPQLQNRGVRVEY